MSSSTTIPDEEFVHTMINNLPPDAENVRASLQYCQDQFTPSQTQLLIWKFYTLRSINTKIQNPNAALTATQSHLLPTTATSTDAYQSPSPLCTT